MLPMVNSLSRPIPPTRLSDPASNASRLQSPLSTPPSTPNNFGALGGLPGALPSVCEGGAFLFLAFSKYEAQALGFSGRNFEVGGTVSAARRLRARRRSHPGHCQRG